MTSKPSIHLGKGATGGAFLLDRAVALGGEINLGPWRALLHRGLRTFTIETEQPVPATNVEETIREKAEKALDLMAVSGSGAYRIQHNWEQAIYWHPAGDKTIVTIHGRLDTPFDLGMSVIDARKPGEAAGNPDQEPSWSPGFRFFRLGQTAQDPYSAFRDAFLAVENMLADLHPRKNGTGKNGRPWREGNRVWLERAIREFDEARPSVEGKSWLEDLDLHDFVSTIYDKVRNQVFHAKENEPFLLPMNPADDAAIRQAIPPLYRLFLEVAADTMKWPLNERPQMEDTLLRARKWLLPLRVWPFCDLADAEDKIIRRTIVRVEGFEDQASLEPGIFETMIPRDALDNIAEIDGWVAMHDGGVLATDKLSVRIPTQDIQELRLRIKASVRLGALVRTGFG